MKKLFFGTLFLGLSAMAQVGVINYSSSLSESTVIEARQDGTIVVSTPHMKFQGSELRIGSGWNITPRRADGLCQLVGRDKALNIDDDFFKLSKQVVVLTE